FIQDDAALLANGDEHAQFLHLLPLTGERAGGTLKDFDLAGAQTESVAHTRCEGGDRRVVARLGSITIRADERSERFERGVVVLSDLPDGLLERDASEEAGQGT